MILTTIFSSCFSIFTEMYFFNNTLKSRKTYIPKPLFVLAFIVADASLNITSFIFEDYSGALFALINTSISIVSIFLLTLLYDTNNKSRILVTILLQTITTFSDIFFTIIVSISFPEILEHRNKAVLFMGSFCVNIIILIFALLFISIWNRKLKQYDIKYNILILITPICSYLIIHILNSNTDNYAHIPNSIITVISILSVLNIVNLVVLQQSFSANEIRSKNLILEKEIDFQKEKYKQLSSSYRNTRKIIHDTKKHYYVIQEYTKNHENEALLQYIKTAIVDLETTYAYYNTGNLVIDSFFTNYKLLFEKNNITFAPTLNINANNVPIEDYDLCIILGNLLDNGLNELCISGIENATFSIEIYENENKKFIIHSINPVAPINNHKNNIEHGYGTENIRNTVKKYKGFYEVSKNEKYETFIVIPMSL